MNKKAQSAQKGDMTMKTKTLYENATLEIIKLSAVDTITASGNDIGEDSGENDGEWMDY